MFRAMRNNIFLAANYLWFHKWRTVVIVVALSLILLIPVLIEVMLLTTKNNVEQRSRSTPLLLGSEGSPLDLTLTSLYFTGNKLRDIPIATLKKIEKTNMAQAIPLYVRFQVKKHPLVGTNGDYFRFRKLKFSEGKPFSGVLQAVIGATLAEETGLKLGDSVRTTSENLFDLDGVYPQDLIITGILRENHTADDTAIFTSIKTTWIIAGIGHRHDDTANTRKIHFHGKPEQFPISAAIIVPNDHKAKTILLGRYKKNPGGLQLITPKVPMQALLATLFKIKKLFYSIVITVSLSTLLTILLAFMLAIKLRSNELDTITRMGCARSTVYGLLVTEMSIMVMLSMLLSSALVFISQHLLSGHLLSLIT